jgi:hypothetical protein
MILVFIQCQPLSYFWRQYIDSIDSGKCYSATPAMWVNGSFNVALDVWMILIPLREIHRLTMHWKKKMGVVIMFLMGTL